MDIVIIGGGVSGVVSAISAKNSNNRVTILERNDCLLKKLLMTGNGRCNYYNEDQNISNYHSEDIDIVSNIITVENCDMVLDFFNKLGIVPKIKNGYYYPYSNQAVSVKNALEEEVKRLGINVIYDALVHKIEKTHNDRFMINYNDSFLCADKVVVSSGSYAYPKTGSDGMGYKFLSDFNHSIVKPVPALVQLKSDFKYMKEWAGVRSDVRVLLFEDNNCISFEEGEIQFTDYGVSGICIMNLSHFVNRGLEEGKKETIKINFIPFTDDSYNWFINHSSNLECNIRRILDGFLNYKISNIILNACGIDGNLKFKDLNEADIRNIVNCISGLEINITGSKGFDNSQVVNGGVKLTEVNYSTFESLKVNGLYIVGELLDVNGNCGGYNLTNCFISGILAGKSIGEVND